jgi:hypothetical protein
VLILVLMFLIAKKMPTINVSGPVAGKTSIEWLHHPGGLFDD